MPSRTPDSAAPPAAPGQTWMPVVQGPLDAVHAHAFAPMFKALGDPVRLRLLSMIASAYGGEVCVCDLTGEFDLSGPTISHHLRVLREAGLVECDRRGTWVYYRLVPAAMEPLAGLLGSQPFTSPERAAAASPARVSR